MRCSFPWTLVDRLPQPRGTTNRRTNSIVEPQSSAGRKRQTDACVEVLLRFVILLMQRLEVCGLSRRQQAFLSIICRLWCNQNRLFALDPILNVAVSSFNAALTSWRAKTEKKRINVSEVAADGGLSRRGFMKWPRDYITRSSVDGARL